MNISQQLMAYSSAGGSGAYIFRPQERMPRQLYTTTVALEVVKVAGVYLFVICYCLCVSGTNGYRSASTFHRVGIANGESVRRKAICRNRLARGAVKSQVSATNNNNINKQTPVVLAPKWCHTSKPTSTMRVCSTRTPMVDRCYNERMDIIPHLTMTMPNLWRVITIPLIVGYSLG
jgi:hypothetical protein